LGSAPRTIEPGRLQRFATSDRRGDLAGWCKLFDDLRGGVFGCHRQGICETWGAGGRRAMTSQQRAELGRQVTAATVERAAHQRQQWADNARRNADLWARCAPLEPGDPVTVYLRRRGVGGAWPPPACLCHHPALAYWHNGDKLGVFPAMVAPIIAPDGRTVALHRTYLTRDGRKADVPTVKKLTCAAGPMAGASIPLHKPAHGAIGVAEGVETALAAWLASGVPTVAAYCAGALAGFLWPAGVQRIVIFADNDKPGREAAGQLKARGLRAGLGVDIMTPSGDGTDWCDVWANRGAAAVERGAAS
jgi:putative DNA primase/helicase